MKSIIFALATASLASAQDVPATPTAVTSASTAAVTVGTRPAATSRLSAPISLGAVGGAGACGAIRDPCQCLGSCGWSSTAGQCVSSTRSQTDCAECPSRCIAAGITPDYATPETTAAGLTPRGGAVGAAPQMPTSVASFGGGFAPVSPASYPAAPVAPRPAAPQFPAGVQRPQMPGMSRPQMPMPPIQPGASPEQTAQSLKASGVTAADLCHLATSDPCKCAKVKSCGWSNGACVAAAQAMPGAICSVCPTDKSCGGGGAQNYGQYPQYGGYPSYGPPPTPEPKKDDRDDMLHMMMAMGNRGSSRNSKSRMIMEMMQHGDGQMGNMLPMMLMLDDDSDDGSGSLFGGGNSMMKMMMLSGMGGGGGGGGFFG